MCEQCNNQDRKTSLIFCYISLCSMYYLYYEPWSPTSWIDNARRRPWIYFLGPYWWWRISFSSTIWKWVQNKAKFSDKNSSKIAILEVRKINSNPRFYMFLSCKNNIEDQINVPTVFPFGFLQERIVLWFLPLSSCFQYCFW